GGKLFTAGGQHYGLIFFLSRDQCEAAGAHEKPDAGSQPCRYPHAPGQSRDDLGLASCERSGEGNGCEAPTDGGSASRRTGFGLCAGQSANPSTYSHRRRAVHRQRQTHCRTCDKKSAAGVGFREYCEAGGLAAYGVNFPHIWRRAAALVDKIFKGAKPADLPIEQATRFEFIINLRTARSLGLDIPATLLARADEVIE